MMYWTTEELKFLTDHKGAIAHAEIARRLGRTTQAVNRKISSLGITKKRTGSRLLMGEKRCSRCLVIKSKNCFANNKTRIDGKDCWCKECRSYRLREKKYGISEREYKDRVEKQNGCCMICGSGCDNLFVDHSHQTGKVRDLLCSACNLVIGNAQENPKILLAAIAYLQKHWSENEGILPSGQDSTGEVLPSPQSNRREADQETHAEGGGEGHPPND